MKKQIPIRYEEELEEDIKELQNILGYWGSASKNRVFTEAVKITAKLVRKIKSKNKKELSKSDIKERIQKMISSSPGNSDII